MVDVLNIPTLSGGGLVTINFVIASVPRGMRIATSFWSEPIVIIDEHEEIISVARNTAAQVSSIMCLTLTYHLNPYQHLY